MIRTAVERANGTLDVSVRELRDAFGIARLTPAGRRAITDQLRRQKLRIEPPLSDLQLGDRVTIVDARRGAQRAMASSARQSSAPSGAPPAIDGVARDFRVYPSGSAPAMTGSSAGSTHRPRSVRRGAVVGGALVVLAIVLAAVFGSGGETAPELADEPHVAAQRSAPEATPQTRAEAIALLALANSAFTHFDVAAGAAILGRIDEAVLEGEPSVRRRMALTTQLADRTKRYLNARNLAERGSYEAAHRKMLALAPFRDAGAKARSFAVLGARSLVSQAGKVVEARPTRALELLDQAERLAPNLAEIDSVRALAASRRQARAAPPAEPVAANCDRNYTGACIPAVTYDLDCGDVAAVNFSSVGSDPHGFDREGDGLACES